MAIITINILKKSVMGVVEGLTATIAQHNPDVNFSAMWASDGEESKLDIYYREAATDLENEISKWISSPTARFDLQAVADDFKLVIKPLSYWPPRFTGLLSNQVQNYFVHAMMVGWLNDFPEVKTSDYASMGVSDIEAIKEILLKKDFSFVEAERNSDSATKDSAVLPGVDDRSDDSRQKDMPYADVATVRASDPNGKDNRSDEVASRTVDGVGKADEGMGTATGRCTDDSTQVFQSEHTDWGGGKPPFILR